MIQRLWFPPTEHYDVRFRMVDHVMNPSHTLLNPQVSPLRLGHQVVPGYGVGQGLETKNRLYIQFNSDRPIENFRFNP